MKITRRVFYYNKSEIGDPIYEITLLFLLSVFPRSLQTAGLP
jgi:hypothetical protein